MELVETVELTATTASITFSSIPQTGEHLLIVLNARGNQANFESLDIKINGLTTNYHWSELKGTTSTSRSNAFNDTKWRMSYAMPGTNANDFGLALMKFDNYTSGFVKKVVADCGQAKAGVTQWGRSLFRGENTNTAAVTSIFIEPSYTSFLSGTTASLYII